MRTWLQNPKIVAILGILALIYMVFTFWPKHIKQTDYSSRKQPPLVEHPLSERQSVPMNESIVKDSLGISLLDSIGWKRKSNRDPFVVEKRRGSMAYWVLGKEKPLDRLQVKSVKKRKKASYSLQAVAIGPAGKLALVSGKWYTEGVQKGNLLFESIAADSVVFKTEGKSQTLHFSTTR